MRKAMMFPVLAMLAGSAPASTPAAWNAMNQRVARACVAMSGLSRPMLLARKISFSDVIGVEIRQLRGVDSRGRMKRLICAYNRSSGRTEIQEGDNWNGLTMKP
jgi:hypothetical protein